LETGRPYAPPASLTLVGLCTGSIAAAAVASSQNVSELITAGVQAVQVAFRLGLCVARVSRAVEPSHEHASRSWTVIVSGVSQSEIEALLTEFSNKRVSGLTEL
jgi:naphtho-gamma-pyrone polyketide synthase